MKKIIKWVLIAFAIQLILLIIITIYSVNTHSPKIEKANTERSKFALDSIISEIKEDKDVKVKKIEITKDSILRITTNNENVVANYFDNTYNILNLGNVAEIEVYYKNELHSTTGYLTAAKINNFQKEFVSGYDGSCRPLEKYIKGQMNNPDSYKHVTTIVSYMLNGNFEVKTTFRGTNAFGGIVTNTCVAEVSDRGEVLSFNMGS